MVEIFTEFSKKLCSKSIKNLIKKHYDKQLAIPLKLDSIKFESTRKRKYDALELVKMLKSMDDQLVTTNGLDTFLQEKYRKEYDEALTAIKKELNSLKGSQIKNKAKGLFNYIKLDNEFKIFNSIWHGKFKVEDIELEIFGGFYNSTAYSQKIEHNLSDNNEAFFNNSVYIKELQTETLQKLAHKDLKFATVIPQITAEVYDEDNNDDGLNSKFNSAHASAMLSIGSHLYATCPASSIEEWQVKE